MEARKAAFMGKITAGVTHDMKNVLAIIKESAGLMEDLMALDKNNALPHKEKFSRSLSRIMDQVARGVDLSTKLNSFAHSPDEQETNMDLNEAIGQTTFVCHKAASLKGMSVKAVRHEKSVPVVADPLALQMLLFQCVVQLMDIVDAGSTIVLRPVPDNGRCVVISKPDEPGAVGTQRARVETAGPRWQELQLIARSLKASVEADESAPRIFVRFLGE
ncbi:MAG: hypothetical protein HY913_19540 [Desulfomonile tiedjei]|nr:hypothetical protein [Desulfomonile tiedjei]